MNRLYWLLIWALGFLLTSMTYASLSHSGRRFGYSPSETYAPHYTGRHGRPVGSGYSYRSYRESYYWRGLDYYYRKPVRYQYPWNRPPLEVVQVSTGPGTFYMQIPEVTFEKPRVEPFDLNPPVDAMPRAQFLIEKSMLGTTRERNLAVNELKNYPRTTSIAVLLDVIYNDVSKDVRLAAIKSIGEMGAASIYEPLKRLSQELVDDELRQATVEVLGQLEMTTAVPLVDSGYRPPRQHGTQPLVGLMEDLRYGRHELREKAVRDMARYKQNRSIISLINAMVNDEHSNVRRSAAQSLGEIADPMSEPFLRAAQQNDLEESVRDAAGKALKKIAIEQ